MRVLLTCAVVAAFAPAPRLLAPPQRRIAARLSMRAEGRGTRALRALAAPPRGVKRAVNYLRDRAPDARTTRKIAKALVWTTAISPLLTSVHPALAYVGYQQEEFDKMRADSGSMKIVLPATIFGILFTTSRQGSIQKKEIKRIKRAYKKIQEEEAEYMSVNGTAESDADIMASLRNRTSGLADDDADEDEDDLLPAGDDAAPAPPPPPPAPKKRMTMAEKIAAKQKALDEENKKK
jgi:hypothetical protein